MEPILLAALALVVGALAVLLGVVVQRVLRPLRRVTRAVDEVSRGHLSVEVPEEGTRELIRLARTVNRMRQEVASRIEAAERERESGGAVLSALQEGVVLFDGDGEVLYQNASSQRLVGRVATLRNLASSKLQEMVRAAVAGTATRGGEIMLEPAAPIEGAADQLPGSAGYVTASPTRTLRVDALPLPGDGHVLLVLRDVTRTRAVDAVRRDFVANASHELKTPVASIRALADTISTAASDDPQAVPRFARQLEREAVRLSRIISDLLDLSRLESQAAERTATRLDRIVAREAERYRQRAEHAGISLLVKAGEPVTVHGAPEDLGLLVRNLVENAVQYTRPGGRIEVTLSPRDGAASLTVRDTGIGIPGKDQGRIFERFYRVDRARSRETGGTGLGLSIVRHVVENHGGTVTVRSRLGEGSTFTVLLPLPIPSP